MQLEKKNSKLQVAFALLTYAQEHQLYYYYNHFREHLVKESKTVSDILNTADLRVGDNF